MKIKLSVTLAGLSFLVLAIILIGSFNKGFDITDESHYILAAKYPNLSDIRLSLAGHFTHLLFVGSSENLYYFRLSGLIVLLLSAMSFAGQIYKYRISDTESDKLYYLVFFGILISVLSYYYQYWLSTPSYNWLSLIGCIMFFDSILRVINTGKHKKIWQRLFMYCIVGAALVVSFSAKPSTFVVLLVIGFLFLIFEHQKIYVKEAVFFVGLFSTALLLLEIYIFIGSWSSYYNLMLQNLEIYKSSIHGNIIGHYTDYWNDFVKFIGSRSSYYNLMLQNLEIYRPSIYGNIVRYSTNYWNDFVKFRGYVFIIFLLIFAFYSKFASKKYSRIGINLCTISYFIIILVDIGSPWSIKILKNVWWYATELLLFAYLMFAVDALNKSQNRKTVKMLVSCLFLVLLFLLGSFAKSFGTHSEIISHMTGSLVFIMASYIVLGEYFYKYYNSHNQIIIMTIILIIFVGAQLLRGYYNPYRLVESISHQNKAINLLNGSLKVDTATKQYIDKLQNIKRKFHDNASDLYLIDMSGGSPGANVIMGAKFFGIPWPAGGYKYSHNMVLAFLKPYQYSETFKDAWLVVAPEGRIKLDIGLLQKLGLDFPAGYEKIGEARTAHRRELQQIWKPL